MMLMSKKCIERTAESVIRHSHSHSHRVARLSYRSSLQFAECECSIRRRASSSISSDSNSIGRRASFSSTASVTKPEERTTHFGFSEVPLESKEELVSGVFQNVASHYDVMNDLMSGGLHRLWKDELLAMTGVGPMAEALRRHHVTRSPSPSSSQHQHQQKQKPGRLLNILDVAGGTGDVAFRFLEAARCPERSRSSGTDEISVTVCDINPHMLAVGRRRAGDRYGDAVVEGSQALRFVEGNAQDLVGIDEGEYDIYTIAFGLRNVTDVGRALEEACRVLKPGGRFLCLEFSKVGNPFLKKFYDAYSFNVIPAVGDVVAGDRDSYQYLVESIRKFYDQDQLKGKMEEAGFVNCKYTNMTGGIVAVHEGWKPLH